ncbi:MAG TPA: fumarylacetoacetate hydrolase family protein [Baekduia sp.]|nr:fumarylacetoacetate hydrolase family protein [Baekduia sp.]
MRLATNMTDSGPRCGLVSDGKFYDAGALAEHAGISAAEALITTTAVLRAGAETIAALAAAVASAPTAGTPLAECILGPPVTDPAKIICLGLNYRDHAAEANLPEPAAPMIFAKFANSLVGPTDDVVIPRVSKQVDYEVELGVVIGRTAKDVPADEALEYVAGVTVVNDVSARDLQTATSQWGAGKAIDTFAPCGPELVFLDEIEDIQSLRLQTRVNGKTVQDGNTHEQIFPVAETIAFLTTFMTLEPGDIIATGTPAGVGMSRTPPLWLKEGDVVETEIESIGVLRNTFTNGT